MSDKLNMSVKIIKWLFEDEGVGASSKAMAAAVLDQKTRYNWTPSDPSDFNRCLLLIEAVPEIKDHMSKIAAISASWSQMISNWDEVEKCFLDEAGRNWSKARRAPITYKLMHDLAAD